MTLFERGMGTLITHAKASIGRPVTYTYGSWSGTPPTYGVTGSGALTVWVGNTKFDKQPGPGGTVKEWGERDYLFAAADFQGLAGTGNVPVRGDRIQDVDVTTGKAITYEVRTSAIEPGQRPSDQTRMVYRVHCKRVA